MLNLLCDAAFSPGNLYLALRRYLNSLKTKNAFSQIIRKRCKQTLLNTSKRAVCFELVSIKQ